MAEEARTHFHGSRGLAVNDLTDLQAILVIDAIERGVIALRVYDPEVAQARLWRRPRLLHAKLIIGDDHVLSGSSNFSNGGLRRNLEFMDDAAAMPELTEARRDAVARFRNPGRDWTQDAREILGSPERLVTPEEAVARTVIEAKGFTPWIAAGTTSAECPPARLSGGADLRGRGHDPRTRFRLRRGADRDGEAGNHLRPDGMDGHAAQVKHEQGDGEHDEGETCFS